MKTILILIIAGLTSCSTSTGIIPMNKGTYFISEDHASPGRATSEKANIYRQANEFCAKQSKQVETIKLDMKISFPFNPGSAGLEFRCIE